MPEERLSDFVDGVMVRLDQASREVCNCYGNSNFHGALREFENLNNPIEAAVVAIMSIDRMSPQVRESFIRFMQLQAAAFHA